MNSVSLLKISCALAFIIFLIIVISYIFSKLERHFSFLSNRKGNKIVKNIEVNYIDATQKIILAECGKSRYLILLSPNGNVLLDRVQND